MNNTLRELVFLLSGLIFLSVLVIGDTVITQNSITTSGNITATANISAAYFFGNGSFLTDTSNTSWNKSLANSLYVDVTGDTMNGSLNMAPGANINISNGYLHVGGYYNESLNRGDVFITGTVTTNSSILSHARNYGAAFMALNSGQLDNYNITSLGGTGTLTVLGVRGDYFATICDTTAPFVPGNVEMFLTVLISTPSYGGGPTGEIETFINSSCIRVSVASAGLRPLVNATNISYVVYRHPLFAVLDRGSSHFHIGQNAQAEFQIHIPNGTNVHSVSIVDTAGRDQHAALKVTTDGHNYDGVIGQNIVLYSTEKVNNKLGIGQLIELDGTNINRSEAHFVEMTFIGQKAVDTKTDAIKIDPNVDHIIHVGDADIIRAAWYNDSVTTINATDYFTNQSNDLTIFENDDSYIYIGSNVNFTEISVSLDTGSSRNILANYYYCNSSGWQTLSGVVDTTEGFQNSGSITFANPTNRGTCNYEVTGAAFADNTNYAYIAIQRTRNNVVTPPVENYFSITGGSTFFVLQSDMLKLHGVSAPPETCNSIYEGGIYYDRDIRYHCACNGTDWVQMDDYQTICV